MNTVCIHANGEYGRFFWHEPAPVKREGSKKNAETGVIEKYEYYSYSCCWCAYTSFGCYGHWWESMGEPFAQFIQDVDQGYLLGKISTQEFSLETFRNNFMRVVEEKLAAKLISAATSRKLKAKLANYIAEYDGDVLAHMVYYDDLIGEHIDLAEEVATQNYPIQARMFAEKLWPEFVKAVAELPTDPVNVTIDCPMGRDFITGAERAVQFRDRIAGQGVSVAYRHNNNVVLMAPGQTAEQVAAAMERLMGPPQH